MLSIRVLAPTLFGPVIKFVSMKIQFVQTVLGICCHFAYTFVGKIFFTFDLLTIVWIEISCVQISHASPKTQPSGNWHLWRRRLDPRVIRHRDVRRFVRVWWLFWFGRGGSWCGRQVRDLFRGPFLTNRDSIRDPNTIFGHSQWLLTGFCAKCVWIRYVVSE